MSVFLYQYLRSMRLYYGFVTGTTALVGVIVEHETQGTAWGWRDAVVLSVGFLAWGVNQIFNDATNLAEDRINAPERPMVTGILNLRKAVILSTLLMVLFGAVSVLLTPWTLLPILAGAGFNLLYSLLKGVPVLGCLVYGASISLCAAYGWIGSLGGIPTDRSRYGIGVLSLMLLPIHALMCHNSFFKDIPGDKAAGKRTLQVIFPEKINLGFSTVLGSLKFLKYRLYYLHVNPMEVADASFNYREKPFVERTYFIVGSNRPESAVAAAATGESGYCRYDAGRGNPGGRRYFRLGRNGIAIGREEHQRGQKHEDKIAARRKPSTEEKFPDIERDIHLLFDSKSQADSHLSTTLRYLNASAANVRETLIENGYSDVELPTERTINSLLNRMGFRLHAVQKSKPQKNSGN